MIDPTTIVTRVASWLVTIGCNSDLLATSDLTVVSGEWLLVGGEWLVKAPVGFLTGH